MVAVLYTLQMVLYLGFQKATLNYRDFLMNVDTLKCSKLRIVALAFLLLFTACSKQEQKSLVLIFENPEPYDAERDGKYRSATFNLPLNSQNVTFVGDNGVLYKFVTTKPYDTLVISSVNRNTVELLHYYSYPIYTEHVLLQANDTVVIRYKGKEKPTYTSLCNEENNRLYQLRDVVLKDFLYDNPEFVNELRKGYFLHYVLQKNPQGNINTSYTSPQNLAEVHYASIPKVRHTLDSLVTLGLLPTDYESYYRYYLRRAEIIPEYERQYVEAEFELTPQQYAFFNDNYVGYISYRDYIHRCTRIFARNGTEWEIPLFETKNISNGATLNLPDKRAVFDRLVEMQQNGDNRISDISYDLMRYYCVEEIGNSGWYPEGDGAAYLEKYKALTTRFLERDAASSFSFWGIPFRILIFILQLNICIAIFYSLYRLFLYKSTAFIACRVFLLSGIVLSPVIASSLLSAKVLLPESLLQLGHGLSIIGWVVMGIYTVCALHLLYMLVKRAIYVYRLWSDSWRIKDSSFLLCILRDIVASPATFFRMVFISWGDYFEAADRENRECILEHERYHAKYMHSIDVVVLMFVRLFCWFNPFFKMYDKELRLVNDYAADRRVVRIAGIRAYMRIIVDMQGQQQEENELLSYGYDGNKNMDKRIAMIRRYDEFDFGWLRFLSIIPVCILLMLISPSVVVEYCHLPQIITTLL